MMKILLIPGNNSLSHLAKCLDIRAELSKKGHDSLIAVSQRSAKVLDRLNHPYAVVPDIQESDFGSSPSFKWFRDIDLIRHVFNAEVDLIKKYRPDRVLGVFRFTTKAAAMFCGVPFDSLICGCMLPQHSEILGFRQGEPGAESQKEFLKNFFQLAGRKMSRALSPFNMAPVTDVRMMLAGERTFLWDFPEFMPLPGGADCFYVGPLYGEAWHNGLREREVCLNHDRPYALLTFGTCCTDRRVVQKLVDCLLEQGYDILIAAGNQKELIQMPFDGNRVKIWPFVPLRYLLPHVRLVISHGGQMTLFESLCYNVPIFVVPFQPEQAHNGICLERIGCGCRLSPAAAYRGDSTVYVDALMKCSPAEISDAITSLMTQPNIGARLAETRTILKRYNGSEKMARLLIQ